MGWFFFVMSFFSKGKGREKLLRQSPLFASDGRSWGSGCTVHAGSSPGACQPPNQPSSQEGVTTSLSLAKVLWLTSKLSVTEGRGGQRESQTLGKVKTLGRRGGRTNRAMLLSGRGMGDASRVMEIRGSAASSHAVASAPHGGTSLLRAS